MKDLEQLEAKMAALEKELAVKNRELEIEAALERVRNRTMTMQRSDELAETAYLLFQQFKYLGEDPVQITIGTFDEKANCIDFSITGGDGTGARVDKTFRAELDEPYLIHKFYTAWKENKPSTTIVLAGEALAGWIKYRNEISDEYANYTPIMASGHRYIAAGFFSKGLLSFSKTEPLADETIKILERFAQVFDLTYTRFLDLQKAEAQAREAQIQLALERVRARTMAMQKSDELTEVAAVLFKQVNELGIKVWTTGFNVWSDDNNSYEDYITNPEGGFIEPYTVDTTKFSAFTNVSEAKKRGEEFFVQYEEGEMIKETYRYLSEFADKNQFEKLLEGGFQFPTRQFDHFVFGSKVSLLFITYEPVTEAHDIFKRFGKVFEQTYIRFLDLQKAETQAREAKIEAALEKVRSRTMAMHHSDELAETSSVLFQELKALNVVKQTDRINITIVDEEERMGTIWATKPGGEYRLKSYRLPIDELEPIKKRWDQFLKLPKQQRKETLIITEYKGKEIIDFQQFIAKYTDLMNDSLMRNAVVEKFYQHSAGFSHGSLDINGFAKLDEDAQNTFKRFAVLFEQTYTRFLDLEKAEAQAREAKIEASLERVRSQTMAMHNSNDVGNAIGILFTELEHLGIATIRCGIVSISEAKTMEAWGAISTKEGKVGQIIGKVDMSIHPLYEGAFEAWKQKKPVYTYELEGQDFLNYYNVVSKSTNYKIPAQYFDTERHICNFFIFKEGGLFTFTKEPFDAATNNILEKFTAVFALTYRRYLDLKIAEEQSRQAVRQASLDRVRAEIASMRTTTDLEKITPLIWNELTNLKVPFIRCGVFIMDEQKQQMQVHLSTPEGKAIAAFQLPYNTKGTTLQVLTHWQNNQTYIDHWNAVTFSEWTKSLVDLGVIKPDEKYNAEKPPENLYLHFLPFLQGMLYVGSTLQLSDDEIKLVQSLADAFSTAYARYEDFNKLEHAKLQIEATLAELKSTQSQLIQKEKMASLGELTAGIAHEIQNPLNFVNNFSEVSTELVEELKGERSKVNGQRDEELELEILNNLSQNLEKINHHGRRADAIVKGMLQHSRANTGKKEPTDINALADEYLRLSYHGLRAKDKDFNADFKTDFDERIGKIEVVPQDIGRVLLNLYNNAFYAASLPSEGGCKNPLNKHKPTIWVTTKRSSSLSPGEGRGEVMITVKDNGPGIPSNIVDKIFQPFFTTKPTGEGTGLGLSLSYDIVKAHGGEIKVKTKEGEGSEFIIQLPIV